MAKKDTQEVIITHWPIEDITPYEMNVKKHDIAQVSGIANAIRRFGFDQPIVVDRNGVIIKGHGRRLAAIELGMKTVPVWHRKDLTVEEARASRLADNRVAQSDIDTEMLRTELSTMEIDMTGIFDEKELEYVKADLGEINTGAFVEDMDAVLEDQRKENEEREEKLIGAEVRVPLAKAFGFKDVSVAGHFSITRFMSKAEGKTGLTGDLALLAFFKSME